MDFMGFMQTMGMSGIPIIAAFFIGLMMSVSPCPLATNITAIAFISRKIDNSRHTLLVGFLYAAGRAFAYVAIAMGIVYAGLNVQAISFFLQDYGEMLLGPFLLIMGILMLDLFEINLPGGSGISSLGQKLSKMGICGSFFVGILFALSFCPFSAVLYFGMLIPIALKTGDSIIIPAVFGIATALPVVVISVLLVRGLSGVSHLMQQAESLEFKVKRVVAYLFIVFGIMSIVKIWLL